MKYKAKLEYKNVHMWIGRHYGKASKCSNKNCPKENKIFQWARKREKLLEKNIKNYIELCRDCHISYDRGRNMKTNEKPKPMIIRFYKSQRKFLKKEAKRLKISEAAVIRDAIDRKLSSNI